MAVSRLDFAPDTREMEVTDIRTGRFVFSPGPERPVSLRALERAITGAGYEIDRSWLEVRGEVLPDGRLRALETGQLFLLRGDGSLDRLLGEARPGEPLTVRGAWATEDGEEILVVQRWERSDTETASEPGDDP